MTAAHQVLYLITQFPRVTSTLEHLVYTDFSIHTVSQIMVNKIMYQNNNPVFGGRPCAICGQLESIRIPSYKSHFMFKISWLQLWLLQYNMKEELELKWILFWISNGLYRQSFCKKCYLQIGNTDFCSVLQQLFSHICLAKLILFCCFARAALARRPNGAKQQERINFAKQMCEKSCWRTTRILQITFFAKWLTISHCTCKPDDGDNSSLLLSVMAHYNNV